jgi:hypothetical protein
MWASLLVACAVEGVGGDSAEAVPTCPEPDLEEVAVLQETDLPTRGDLRHTVQGAAVGDLDGDGWLDVLVAWGGGSFVMMNDGTGQLAFDDRRGAGDTPLSPAVAAALADLDGDGDLDAVLSGWTGDSELLWNDGTGHFAVTTIPGSAGATFASAFGDADGDGDLDLYLSAAASNMTYDLILSGEQVGDPNLLFLQDADHDFLLAPDALPADTRFGMTLHTAWLDVEGDGDLDLYVGNDAGPFIEPNHLLLNDGHAHFTKATDCACDLEMLSMGVAVGDANQDGLPDLYVTDVGSPTLLLNMGDTSFVDATQAARAEIPESPESMVSWGTAFVDLDADMDQDLVVTFGQSGQNFAAAGFDGEDGPDQPDQLLLSDGAGHFSRAVAPGFQDGSRTRAMALGDFDRDGRPDLITVGKYFYRQWHATGGCDPGVTLQFFGKNAIGARVDTTVWGITRTSWNLPSTTSSASAEEVYIGLAGAERADRILVTWPGGAQTELLDVAPGPVRLDQP